MPNPGSYRGRALAALAGLLIAACTSAPPATSPRRAPVEAVRPVPALDLPRYMGRWYEIARLPNRFQQACVTQSTADYRLRPDGEVDVSNRCREADGRIRTALGRARLAGPAGAARLEVRFAPAWLSWLPAVWGDYWVVDLAPDYRLAAVGEPRRDYLWVLSRSPEVDAAAYRALLTRLAAQGFAVERLVVPPAAPVAAP